MPASEDLSAVIGGTATERRVVASWWALVRWMAWAVSAIQAPTASASVGVSGSGVR